MNDLNELMATEVMGYILDSANWKDYYGDSKTNEFIIATEDWHPDTDLNQAVMCADKFIEYKINSKYRHIVITLGDSHNYQVDILNHYGKIQIMKRH